MLSFCLPYLAFLHPPHFVKVTALMAQGTGDVLKPCKLATVVIQLNNRHASFFLKIQEIRLIEPFSILLPSFLRHVERSQTTYFG
ncbi:hypothetical protein MRB53_023059 [Persea americana]|uniref:Uncharacterized protein n=1 Tax=Persea americana TaxID=3435 RepID=A0ACC2L962_PERAE|nr:hypothetical protein MRB53_023059 [Persea americana]